MAGLGIDFGTTNSIMVSYDQQKGDFNYFSMANGKPAPISSTIWYHDKDIEVGQDAREAMYLFAEDEGHHFERSIKLKLGTDKTVSVFGDVVQPYMIAGEILKNIKTLAQREHLADRLANLDINKAVFTVPINFSGKARRDLRAAANEAGIEIITFIHEPFAAVVGYIFSQSNAKYADAINKLRTINGQYVLTFDWGGGTLDITVIRIENGRMVECGTSELTNMAGDKFDEDIARFAWSKFLEQYGGKYSDDYLEKQRRKKWGRMIALAERCKIALSTELSFPYTVNNITGYNENIDFELTRGDLDHIVKKTLLAAEECVKQALDDAGIQPHDISHVLLTGGTCYIPAVQSMMTELFGHRVKTVEDAELVIAQGAAVISEMNWRPFLTKSIKVALCDGSYWPMFEQDTVIGSDKEPARSSEVFTCVDQRTPYAKVVLCEIDKQRGNKKTLSILKVPTSGNRNFGDDIYVEAELDRDIVMTLSAHSNMAQGNSNGKSYSIRKRDEIHQLCFGLDFEARG